MRPRRWTLKNVRDLHVDEERNGDLISVVDRILNAIDKTVQDFSAWSAGITEEPDDCRKRLGSPRTWQHWNAKSPEAASIIVEYLRARGMKGVRKRLCCDEGSYVYIFKHRKK
jgi:hypothetical protein